MVYIVFGIYRNRAHIYGVPGRILCEQAFFVFFLVLGIEKDVLVDIRKVGSICESVVKGYFG